MIDLQWIRDRIFEIVGVQKELAGDVKAHNIRLDHAEDRLDDLERRLDERESEEREDQKQEKRDGKQARFSLLQTVIVACVGLFGALLGAAVQIYVSHLAAAPPPPHH